MKHNFSPQQENLLESFLSNYNISFNQETFEQLYLYADLVLEWNSKTNLISKNDAPKFISRHITDSLVPYIFLSKELKLKNNSKWADMGSGAGCPVIPLSIVLPDITFYAVEPRNKRVFFLNEVKQSLNLKNITVIGKRFETSGLTDLDFISCRALSTFENDWKRAKNNLNKNGLFITLKSVENISHLRNHSDIKIIEYRLPEEQQHYAIVIRGIHD
ncbi:MAG: 16S rRNA (guanine(527)-N(7))-methyltransferase RsmG [Crenarchaeota archaeon]|nr:16S rRNA (guanine(527)-N(7))-methyltransferase RsmG [Thermoproteota archaeon]